MNEIIDENFAIHSVFFMRLTIEIFVFVVTFNNTFLCQWTWSTVVSSNLNDMSKNAWVQWNECMNLMTNGMNEWKIEKNYFESKKTDKRLNWTFLLTRCQLQLSIVGFVVSLMLLLDLNHRCFDPFNQRMCDDRYRNVCANHLLLQTWSIFILGVACSWITFIVEQLCVTWKFLRIFIVLLRIVSIMEHGFRAIWMQNKNSNIYWRMNKKSQRICA